MTAAERALEFISDGQIIGLGTGRAAVSFVEALAVRVRSGLNVQGVPTSQSTADLATGLGIPLTTLEAVEQIDITFDGADEVDPELNLIKGYGGALVREKIVAASSRRLVILVGTEKLVSILGERGRLPVEVVPFGLPLCRRRLRELGCAGSPRMREGQLYVTDNGNYIVDCAVAPIANPAALEAQILAIPGVVGTGLFIHMADTVLIQDGENVQMRRRP